MYQSKEQEKDLFMTKITVSFNIVWMQVIKLRNNIVLAK